MQSWQLETYVKKHNLPKAGGEYLRASFETASAQTVRDRAGSVISPYPSSKSAAAVALPTDCMTFAMTFEAEGNVDVLCYLKNLRPITLAYHAPKRLVTTQVFPSIAVIGTKGVTLIEATTCHEALALCKAHPHRYVEKGENLFGCPAAEVAAKELGFEWKIVSDANFTGILVENLRRLRLLCKRRVALFSLEQLERLKAVVAAVPGISLKALAERLGPEGDVMVRWAIAHQIVYVDLSRELVTETESTFAFASQEIAAAAAVLGAPKVTAPDTVDDVINHPLTKVMLKYGISAFNGMHRRWQLLMGHIGTDFVARRILRRYKQAAIEAEEKYGPAFGYLGLILRNGDKGRKNQLDKRVYAFARDFISNQRETILKNLKHETWELFKNFLKEGAPDLGPPSYNWWCLLLNKGVTTTALAKNDGARTAYPFSFNTEALRRIWDSAGRCPFASAVIDHVQLPRELCSALTARPIGNPWLSILRDGSTRVLGKHIGFDSPGSASVMMVLRDCIVRHRTLPFAVAIANSKEFRSTFLEAFLAGHGIMRAPLPPRDPFPNEHPKEKFAMLDEEYATMLEGCANALDSLKIATIEAASKELDRHFGLHNDRVDRFLGITSAEAATILKKRAGIYNYPPIPFDNDLLLQTMPEVPGDGGYLTVQRPCMVDFRDVRFYADELSISIGEKVFVRWDPWDVGRVIVHLKKRAIQAESKYAEVIRRLSVEEAIAYSVELHARARVAKNAEQQYNHLIAQFLLSTRTVKETELLKRRDLCLSLDARLAAERSAQPKAPALVPFPKGLGIPISDTIEMASKDVY